MKKFAYSVLLVAAGGLLTLALARPAQAGPSAADDGVSVSSFVSDGGDDNGYWLVGSGRRVHLIRKFGGSISVASSATLP